MSFVLHSWWVSSFPCYVLPPYCMFLVNLVAFFICIVSLLWVQSFASCVLPPCYALIKFFNTFFSCTSLTIYGASLSLPCCALLMFFWALFCSFSNLYLPFNFFNVEAWKKVFLQIFLQLPTQTSSNLWTCKMLEEYFLCFPFLKIFCEYFFKKYCLKKIIITIMWELPLKTN
jgi:hypothetical protein